ncbi:hypothetical protein M3I54_41425 [Paraburkholderia sp. CNPSo 3274]|nr:hypothetical protein [Paraburkholderia sp. CNPSo 3274]MCP3713252.1 hypothetical protein [Paraburkholderia sp. CNPSo 3274]
MRQALLARLIGLLFSAIVPGQIPNTQDQGALRDQVSLVNAIVDINPL